MMADELMEKVLGLPEGSVVEVQAISKHRIGTDGLQPVRPVLLVELKNGERCMYLVSYLDQYRRPSERVPGAGGDLDD